ncbi:MAG: hypothetical protein HRT61_25105 [Ekhidna sp.]|nr:hypothetical protein [Ekhidna sp.]
MNLKISFALLFLTVGHLIAVDIPLPITINNKLEDINGPFFEGQDLSLIKEYTVSIYNRNYYVRETVYHKSVSISDMELRLNELGWIDHKGMKNQKVLTHPEKNELILIAKDDNLLLKILHKNQMK